MEKGPRPPEVEAVFKPLSSPMLPKAECFLFENLREAPPTLGRRRRNSTEFLGSLAQEVIDHLVLWPTHGELFPLLFLEGSIAPKESKGRANRTSKHPA